MRPASSVAREAGRSHRTVMSPTRSDVPDPAVRRLSLYLRQLEVFEQEAVATVSSRKLATALGLPAAQVRKDLTYFGHFGRPGVGYEVTPLIARLRSVLGTDRIQNAILVGLGNLGRALAAYQGFGPKGFRLVALFDDDPKKHGKIIAGLAVESMDRLRDVTAQHGVRLAVTAVPASASQVVADRLIEAGIRGILNFAPGRLRVPPGVVVRSLDVAAELEQLGFQARTD